jgi:archaellum component FlaC
MFGNTEEAQRLADLFTRLAAKVDEFRNTHYDELSRVQRDALEEKIQQLYDFQDQFAGEVIQGTIDALQGDIGKLVSVARQANEALDHLKRVEQIVSLVSAAAALAAAIVTGGYGEIPEDIRTLVQALPVNSDKPVEGV